MNCRDEPTDGGLIAAALAGDDEAFAALVSRYKGRVLGIAARFTRDDHALDDLAQEIFVKVYRHLRQYRGDAPFEHWLARVAVRTCYDYLRRNRPDRALVPLDGRELRAADNPSADQARELVEFALQQLPPADRLVITLLELEELSVAEIAALTGWSVANVKVRAFRARQRMKQILEAAHER